RVCPRLAVGLAGIDFASADSLFPARADRNSCHRSAGVAQPRGRVPRISTRYQRLCAVVSEKGESVSGVSQARWLPAAQERPEKRFWYEPLLESGLVPDAVIRVVIRRMLSDRL